MRRIGDVARLSASNGVLVPAPVISPFAADGVAVRRPVRDRGLVPAAHGAEGLDF